jgi:hypothetical protein
MGSTKRLLNKGLCPDKALLIVALRVLAQKPANQRVARLTFPKNKSRDSRDLNRANMTATYNFPCD